MYVHSLKPADISFQEAIDVSYCMHTFCASWNNIDDDYNDTVRHWSLVCANFAVRTRRGELQEVVCPSTWPETFFWQYVKIYFFKSSDIKASTVSMRSAIRYNNNNNNRISNFEFL